MNKNYELNLDLQFKNKQTQMYFNEFDANTSDFFIRLNTGGSKVDVTNSIIVLAVIKPNGTTDAQWIEVKKDRMYCNLENNLKDIVGTYSAKAMLVLGEQSVVTDTIHYTVEEGKVFTALNNDVKNDTRYNLLTDMLNRLSAIEISETIRELNEEQRLANEEGRKASQEDRVREINAKILEANKVIEDTNKAIAAGTQDLEVKKARIDLDGVEHEDLSDRLKQIELNSKVVYETVEGSFITVRDAIAGAITDIEILGNTYQDPNTLEITSSCTQTSDGRYKMSISSCGKNLNSELVFPLGINADGSENKSGTNNTTGYNRVNPNTTYTTSINGVKRGTNQFYYDKNKVFIGKSSSPLDTFTTPSNCYYTRHTFGSSREVLFKLEEGTVATQYEPYQESKSDILLPCQLGKGDRLYYDEVEKAYCIDKYETTKVFDGSENILQNGSPFTNVTRFKCDISNLKNAVSGGVAISNKFPFIKDFSLDEPHFYYDSNGIHLFIPNDELVGISVKEWCVKNKLEILYQATTPQKIILPLSTRVALNSFFGTNHVWIESGDIEGTIKFRVAKSTSASLQTAHEEIEKLHDKVEAIEGLKESQNMRYETNKGYLIAEKTVDGVVKDVLVKGKTLVNEGGIVNGTFNQYAGLISMNKQPNRNSIYTLKVTNKGANEVIVYVNEQNFKSQPDIKLIGGETKVVKVESLDVFSDVYNRIIKSASVNSTQFSLEVTFLEGDYTQNPPPYFERMKSVGHDVDVVELSSRKEDGNLIPPFNKWVVNNNSTGSVIIEPTKISGTPSSSGFSVKYKIFLSGEYKFIAKSHAGIGLRVRLFKEDNKTIFIANALGQTFTIPEGYYYVAVENNGNTSTDFIIEEFALYSSKNDIPKLDSYLQHKKAISYFDYEGNLVKLGRNQPIREFDYVEEKNGKTFVTIGSGEVVFNGSENWQRVTVFENYDVFFIPRADFSSIKVNSTIICDKYISVDTVSEIGQIGGGNAYAIQISDTKGLSVVDFKAKLQANNVTVVYQLAEPKTYEALNLNLNSYANETMISVKAGAISPHVELSITSHINELVKNNQSRINLLESDVIRLFKILLAQGVQGLAYELYPGDFEKEDEIMLLPVEPVE